MGPLGLWEENGGGKVGRKGFKVEWGKCEAPEERQSMESSGNYKELSQARVEDCPWRKAKDGQESGLN